MKRLPRAGAFVLSVALVAAAGCGTTKNVSAGKCPTTAPTASFGAVCSETIAGEVPSNLRAKGTLAVATDAAYAPDEFFDTDNKTIIGFDIDLGNAIATVLGLKFSYSNATFNTIIPGLASGKFDIGLSSFTDNAERRKTVDFVDYFQAGASIFVKADSGFTFKTLDELCGLAVSAEKGTTEVDDVVAQQPKCVAAGKKKINLLQFDTQDGANLAVETGRAVASLADSQVAAYQVKVTKGKVKVTGDYLSPAPYGIALPRPSGSAPGSGPLTKPIFDALKSIFDSGVYKRILDKWGIAAGAIAAPKINGVAG